MGSDMTEKISLNFSGKKLVGVFHLAPLPSPFVFLSHGLLSAKDSQKYIDLANMLLDVGISSLRFDFLGCGESEGKIEDTTLTSRIEQLNSFVKYVKDRFGNKCLSIGLMGSSLGGVVSLLLAAKRTDVDALVIWATPSSLSGLEKRINIEGMPELKDDFFKDIERYDILSEIREVSKCLVIHGTDDEVVPYKMAKDIYESLKEPKEIFLVPSADHRFLNMDLRKKAAEKTVSWFRRHLFAS